MTGSPLSAYDEFLMLYGRSKDFHHAETTRLGDLAARAIRDRDAEIARLTEELAPYQGKGVLMHCMRRDVGRFEGDTAGQWLLTTDTAERFTWNAAARVWEEAR